MDKTKLVQLIRNHGSNMTPRELMRASHSYPKARNAQEALSTLAEDGLGSFKLRKKAKGRPTMAFYLSGVEVAIEDGGSDFAMTETESDIVVNYVGERWMSVDEIIVQLNLDMAIWRVDKVEQKGYEVTGKLNRGQKYNEEAGGLEWLPQTLWKSKNRYIAVRLVRQAPKGVQSGIEGLIARVKWPTVPASRIIPKRNHFMEISIYDCHYGKYAWAPLTGENYDTKIAERVMFDAVEDLIAKTESFPVDRVILPVGHDFFNVDSWLGATSAGTLVESCDTRFSKVFSLGVDAMMSVVDRLRSIANVEVIYVGGNHDMATSFYLCKVLEAAYRYDENVDVDVKRSTEHGPRKYRMYGKTLLGYTHGSHKDSPKEAQLPLLMATERPKDWAVAVDKAWRLGHLHTKRTSIVPIGNVFNGVRIERLPSLSATDEWHYSHGFVGNRRAAEAWLWSYENGYEAQFTSYVTEDEEIHKP